MKKNSKPSKSEVLLVYLCLGGFLAFIFMLAHWVKLDNLLGTAFLIGLTLFVMFAPRR